jgi:preprotein translocase subunit SecE
MATEPKVQNDEPLPDPSTDDEARAMVRASVDAVRRVEGADETSLATSDPQRADDEGGEVVVPKQLGTGRFVYAAYGAAAVAMAFLGSKLGMMIWQRLSTWKPVFGEPREDLVVPIVAVISGAVAIYYFRHTRTRELAEEVARELSKVTWPSRNEVTNSTTVVIVTTMFATIFFALMDRFYSFITNLVYGT